ncbi:DUF6389 family protein [Streptomyces sp. YIM 132580]|uniref:DUF6389 family protein n=1 Tax=Streptomyces sp. YIM 132580 TaxID=2691958 RepID=UPI00301CD8E6
MEPPQDHQKATDASRYRAELRRVLDTVSPDVARRLAAIRDTATERTDGVVIDVFPDQDGEGTFAVWARFEGSDAFALDRRLGDDRQLLAVVHSETGWTPPVPDRPASWSAARLGDVLFDVVAEWIDALVPPDGTGLSWEVTAPDGTQERRPVGPGR